MCMTHRLNVLYKCMKIRLNTSNGYQDKEQTRNNIAYDIKENNSKISKAEVLFLKHDTLPYCLLEVYEVFNQIALTVFKRNLQRGHKLNLVMLQGE